MNDIERNQQWLEERLAFVWQRAFPDLEPVNEVVIAYGQRARTRLGSIRMSRDKKTSKILINRLFQNEEVPVEIVDVTIAHELTHYLHGFSSPLKQLYRTPHAGGVVDKELKKRGFGATLVMQKKWLAEQWPQFLRAHVPQQRRRRRVVRRRRSPLVREARRLIRLFK
jgi:hypothetical protein